MNFQKVVCHIQGFSLKVFMGRTLAAVPCVLRASGCSPVRPLRAWYTYFQLKMNIIREHHTRTHTNTHTQEGLFKFTGAGSKIAFSRLFCSK